MIRSLSYKTFSCSTQMSTKFILLINVKMPTIVACIKKENQCKKNGILRFSGIFGALLVGIR